jgi:hypothetical protein
MLPGTAGPFGTCTRATPTTTPVSAPVAPSLLRHGAREPIDAIPHGPGRTNAVEIVAPAGGPGHAAPSLAFRTRPHEGCPLWPHEFGSSVVGPAHSTNSPRRGAVTVTVGLLAAAATNRLPTPTCRSAWCRRVPMLYGTRLRSRPALLPRVSGVTCEFVTRHEALDGRGEPHRGDSDLRAPRADDAPCNGSLQISVPGADPRREVGSHAH